MIIPADGGQGRRLVLTETSARPFPGFFTEDDFFFGRKMPLSCDRGMLARAHVSYCFKGIHGCSL